MISSYDESVRFAGREEIRLLADVAELAHIALDNEAFLRRYPRRANDRIIRAFIDELTDICESVE
jgi:hypothetical protein